MADKKARKTQRISIYDFPDDRLMTTKDLAHILGWHPTALAAVRADGRGPAYYRIGGRIYYRGDDVAAWLRECRHEGAKPYRRGKKEGRAAESVREGATTQAMA